MDTAESQAILLHDIRAAMVNHGGLHHEIEVSLLQLTELLQSGLPETAVQAGIGNITSDEATLLKIQEIFAEDLDQCLPMLQVSSDKLMGLLHRFVHGDEKDLQAGNPGI